MLVSMATIGRLLPSRAAAAAAVNAVRRDAGRAARSLHLLATARIWTAIVIGLDRGRAGGCSAATGASVMGFRSAETTVLLLVVVVVVSLCVFIQTTALYVIRRRSAHTERAANKADKIHAEIKPLKRIHTAYK